MIARCRSIANRLRWLRWIRVPLLLAGLLLVSSLTGCMERLYFIPTQGMTPVSRAAPGTLAIDFNSKDSTRLHGWLIPAYGDPSQIHRHATVLHLHGNAGNILSHDWFTAHLPPAGFNVFLFDYRGYGQSGGSARKRGPLLEDAHAALDMLLAHEDIDPGRIGLYAQSLGGALGLCLMAERSEIRAAVVESAFDDWQTIAANALGGDPPGWVARTFARMLIPSGKRPLDSIQQIKQPVLLAHGTDDRVVPISHGRRLAANGGASVQLIEFEGGQHNTLRTSHPEYEQSQIEFLSSHLKPLPDQSSGF